MRPVALTPRPAILEAGVQQQGQRNSRKQETMEEKASLAEFGGLGISVREYFWGKVKSAA